MSTKHQLQYQSPQHPKGPDYWQTTRTFGSLQTAEAAAEKVRTQNPEWRVRVIPQPR